MFLVIFTPDIYIQYAEEKKLIIIKILTAKILGNKSVIFYFISFKNDYQIFLQIILDFSRMIDLVLNHILTS